MKKFFKSLFSRKKESTKEGASNNPKVNKLESDNSNTHEIVINLKFDEENKLTTNGSNTKQAKHSSYETVLKLHELQEQYSSYFDHDREIEVNILEPNKKEVKALIKEKKFDAAFTKSREVIREKQSLKTLFRLGWAQADYYDIYAKMDRVQNTEKSRSRYLYHRLMNIILGNLKNIGGVDYWEPQKYFNNLDHILDNSFSITFRNKNYFEIYLDEIGKLDKLDDIKKDVLNYLNLTFPNKLDLSRDDFQSDKKEFSDELKIKVAEVSLRRDWTWVVPDVSEFVNDLERKYLM